MRTQTSLSTDLCRAFRKVPDPAGLFLSEGHRGALQSLIDAVALKRSIVLIRGVSGSGKTMLVNALIARLGDRSSLKIVALTDDGDLAQHLQELADRIDPGAGPEILLLIDDLLGFSGPVIDQVIDLQRGFHPAPLRSIVLLGKDEKAAVPPALADHLSDRIQLPPLRAGEIPAYLAHRLTGARGLQPGNETPFSADAARVLHDLSGGVPRFVDYFAERALFEAAREGSAAVDADLLRASLLDMDVSEISAGGAQPWRPPDKPVAPVATPERAAPLMAEPRLPDPAPPRRLMRWASLLVMAVGVAGLWFAWLGTQRSAVTEPPAAQPVVAGVDATQANAALPEITSPAVSAKLPKAAVLDHPDPDAFLAQALVSDAETAAIAYERAALLGNPRAAHFLGQIYEAGLGVPQDLQRAQAWYSLAFGIDAAEARLQALATLSPPLVRVAPPVPLRHDLFAGGQTVLHWRNGPGAAPSRYEIEYRAAHDQQPTRTQTTLSAMLLPVPVMRWRVISLDGQGRRASVSAWAYPAPRGR